MTTDRASVRRLTGESIGYPAWNLLYYSLLCALAPQRAVVHVFETGTNKGFSTIMLAQALADADKRGTVRTVDFDPKQLEQARENVEKAGLLDYVEFFVGDSLTVLPPLLEQVDRVDFAFLDGCHEGPQVVAEFEVLHPKLTAPNSTVYFDNTGAGGVADAIRTISRRFGGNLVQFPNCSWGPPGNTIWQPDCGDPD